jgi:hypothetical protein
MEAPVRGISRSLLFFAVVPTLVVCADAHAQTPLESELQVNTRTELTQDSQQVAVGRDGSFAVAWVHTEGETTPYTPVIAVRFYSRQGLPLGPEHLSAGASGEYRHSPFVTTTPSGGFQVLAIRYDLEQLLGLDLERYSAAGEALGGPVTVAPPDRTMLLTNVVRTSVGRLVLSWITNQDFPRREVKVLKLSPRGFVLGDELTISADPENPLYVGDVEVDGAGNAVVVWSGECGSFGQEHCDVFAQRLSYSGDKLGDPIRVNTETQGLQEAANVAVAPDGSFLVVWHSAPGYPEDRLTNLFGQRFSAAGDKLGEEFQINSTVGPTQWNPQATADPSGNYLVVWPRLHPENGFYGWHIRGRLYRPDGRPVAREFQINSRNTFNEFPEPKAAFGGNGTFVVVWNADDGDFDGVFGQRFAASPGDEACVVRGGRFLCDTGHTAREPELELSLTPEDGDRELLGDVDGDGRDDPCAANHGRFRCDLDHRGAEAVEVDDLSALWAEGDQPLLGDVDGDGRADACLRRGDLLACDTAHDGGDTEWTVRFGPPGREVMLGDVDGDGRAEPCVWWGGWFRCDTGHDGGTAETRIAFGEAGDEPLLGDADGDGRDDPCVFRPGIIRSDLTPDARAIFCDTAHDGGEAEWVLAIGAAGDRPLFGNLDGL